MLSHHLNIVCDDVWNRLGYSKKYSISQGEETITDNLLLYLALQNLTNISIIQTPKNKEAIKGTDWEWWIGNRRSGYLRYAVQAKKLDFTTGRYESLNHKVGKGASAKYQHNILEAYSNANNAIPLYAFYNHLDPSDYPATWNCSLPIDYPKFGCTVTPLKNVKLAISKRGWRTFDKIHQFSETIPLRCLAVCPNIAFVSTSAISSKVYIPRFDLEATVYQSPWGILSDIGHITDFKDLPDSLYDHNSGYYPKKILIIETSDDNLPSCAQS